MRGFIYQALTIRAMSEHRLPERDRPWVIRTYSGHSDARRSNELYRKNLAKGQTGLSVAFDLPTQTGYDPDAELARGEVGKVGVSIAHKGDMHALLDGIPLDEMNTSMTINATAAWLLALYATVAEENGVERSALAGTTQNDIIKEYLSRGTYAFPPGPSMRLIADTVAFTVNEIPKWNPINVCSYHLQEAGATPIQEIAYALSTAIAVLDEVKARGQVADDDFPKVFGRISFFVNAGVRFIEEHAKLRAMGEMWEWIGRNRYGVTEPKFLRLRYGVQVNSLGLTESQPENNVPRIVLEALAVTLGRDARARAIQLPAWNEALGLPRPWDQQWSLRIQQILANETDLLEYPDIFEGSKVMDGLVAELVEGAKAEMNAVEEKGGAVEAVPYMKAQLVESNRERIAKIERGEITVVGQNKFTETEESPLTTGEDGGILTPDPEVERERIAALEEWKAERDQGAVEAASTSLAEVARDESANILPATMEAAKAGATTGEWAGDAPRGLRRLPRPHRRSRGGGRRLGQRRPARRGPRARLRGLQGDRPPDPHPGRQARPRRALERRRADRGPCPRRRHGGDLPGHSPDPRADRQVRGRGGRRRGRALDPLGLPPRARAACGRAAARRRRGHPGGRRRHHPGGRRGRHARGRCRRGLHAEGLRDQPDHGRDRGAGGRPSPRRATGLMAEPELNGDRSSWLRCYRCWARDLEVQLHYDAILRVDPDSGEPSERLDEVQEAVVQCLRCLHDQPHLTIQEDRVVPVEDRWERMVAGTPWVASCTVTVDQDQVESCSGPEAGESLTYGSFGEQGTREFFTHVRFHKHDEERIIVHLLVELYARSAEEATEVLEEASRGVLEITSLAEESRPPAHAPDEAH